MQPLDILLNTRKNVFISGAAGTGKTTLLLEYMNKTSESVIVIAPTAIAAYNVNGITIHNCFGLPVTNVYDHTSVGRKIPLVDTIVIDEISMVRPDLLDCVFNTIQAKNKSINSYRWIFVGDMGQLNPILRTEDEQLFFNNYRSLQFFDALLYPNLYMEKVELQKVYRQNDPEFIAALHDVRMGKPTTYFNQFYVQSIPKDAFVIAPHKSTVDRINNSELAKLRTPLVEFEPIVNINKVKADIPVLQLKEGSKIVITSNKVSTHNPILFNGARGILKIKMGVPYIEIDDVEYEIPLINNIVTEGIGKYKKPVLSYYTYPISLGYSMTVHKVQGMTIKTKMCIDLSRGDMFAKGQLYVAYSRVSSPYLLSIFR